MKNRSRIPPEVRDHLDWLGLVQPTGLVVSATALSKAGAVLPRRDAEGQTLLRDCLEERPVAGGEPEPVVPDFERFARSVLGWRFAPSGFAGTPEAPLPDALATVLPGSGDTLRPDYAVRQGNNTETWQLLVRVLPPEQDFDAALPKRDLSPRGEMERLLRAASVPAGVLCNGRALRLISAPEGENSGWLDFRFADLRETAGRPLCAALRLLLGERRLLGVPEKIRLAALLESSRKHQNDVSERLAVQVLHALYELLRGLQAAHDQTNGRLLGEVLTSAPNRIYRSLLIVVLRLVFLLYAEERDLLPTAESEVFLRHYSLTGLYERLREDAARHPDTMDARFGAWAGLLALFRMVHDGARSGKMRLPPRHGVLFDPDEYKFLEGRGEIGARQIHERIEPPRIPDGAIHRALKNLLVLDGERVSYRALDVEHIGTVYETMMGFRLETATGPSKAIRAAKKGGAPTVVNFDDLLATPPKDRAAFLRKTTDRKLTAKREKALREADTMEALAAALDPIVDQEATPKTVPPGALILQPSQERRRSGSHYTPRSLTEPIVRRTLEPTLTRLSKNGRGPTPDEILDLKVCDPAMGSGAFLVEACRQLGDALTTAWREHGGRPAIPPDEDETILARRMVARRCLFGVDRNPVAVDLAKLSLWLATLARDHPLTFVDHALRAGDSLVGLTKEQIARFHWLPDAEPIQLGFESEVIRPCVERVAALRERIRTAGEAAPDRELRALEREAREEAEAVTLLGDLALSAFFDAPRLSGRKRRRLELARLVVGRKAPEYRAWLDQRQHADPPFAPFHWEIEYPEVFDRANPGFDAIVGNPPFLGGKRVTTVLGGAYRDWLASVHVGSNRSADLVAHFFRRAFAVLRHNGALGFIATNTIAQGDTRSAGLRRICENGGEIYEASRNHAWPGPAAVVVSIVHVYRGKFPGSKRLDGAIVKHITAFLLTVGGHQDPARLADNTDKSFQGSIVLGMGFTFDDTTTTGPSSSIADAKCLLRDDRNRRVIVPYIGGEELTSTPTHSHHRYVIDFRDFPLCRRNLGESWTDATEERRRTLRTREVVPLDYPGPVAADWPPILAIIEGRVKPMRMSQNRKAIRERWWQHADKRPGLYAAIGAADRVLAISRISHHFVLAFLAPGMVYSDGLIVFVPTSYAAFSSLQCRPHELWSQRFGSSFGAGRRYTPSDCFETFPFVRNWASHPGLEFAGQEYYEHRARLMLGRNEGLTKTYNRFHDPDDDDSAIIRLRELHDAMDRAVLAAYGWTDLSTDCRFTLDNEEDGEDEDRPSRRRKPWRYRWPDEVRDEVLARLLALNVERAAEEEEARKARGLTS